ncbi:uncharacterized protein C8R40DRAFT_1118782 [Lentinula edodes]|uniref:uncharacterized protein n=1 Tax=Lentinula edodes TaxID=5353 RepID=UPI001E8CB227|nr:uncharacterized protein C8R40DRAFT_1118782 [Lentinula edodes]KAH7872179.1 hypothetical protein C8R40DRAFT_1118782 [Lentinula edodes]
MRRALLLRLKPPIPTSTHSGFSSPTPTRTLSSATTPCSNATPNTLTGTFTIRFLSLHTMSASETPDECAIIALGQAYSH